MGGVSCTNARKKVSECHSSLCPSEKELLAHSITKIPLLGNVPATKKGI
jgi:hypothetical protein